MNKKELAATLSLEIKKSIVVKKGASIVKMNNDNWNNLLALLDNVTTGKPDSRIKEM